MVPIPHTIPPFVHELAYMFARHKSLTCFLLLFTVLSRKDLETFRDVLGSLDSLVPDDRNEMSKYSNSANEKDCL
jgi:hypothetical protein